MNDRWLKKDGKRWNRPDKIRAARLFRAHVDTPHNRAKGRSCRIHREACYFCLAAARRGGWPREEHLPRAPFHHLDYARPFFGVWVCDPHHRKIDHGLLRVPRKAMRDYGSDIALVSKRWQLRSERRTTKVEPPPLPRGPLGSVLIIHPTPAEAEAAEVVAEQRRKEQPF